ncbi:hypothetical protein N6H18_10810 [Reichenbachiella agarivorans]|uniref:ATP10 protein n=1 Tax=Reichenbachiella agarivorans TaxID=2979464 RepID=A0ABY6CK05_9BACT|nr:hypothetical protein [Reichenbachiella agarivorans]UXP30843.1 hypothetical protein N6H18_10810 [Reichenbachiella agarivorans]
MKTIYLVIAFILLTISSYAQESAAIGSTFPNLEAESFDTSYNLPEDSKGKYTIIGLTYNKKSQEALMDWIVPIYQEFLSDGTESINAYFVIMFSGVNAAAEGIVRQQVNESIDPLLLPHILYHKGGLKKYQEVLDMLGRKDTSYYFILDPEGTILWATRGRFKQEKIDKIRSLIK